MKFDLAWTLIVQGRILAAKGDKARAKETFVRAARMFEEMGIERDLDWVRAEIKSIA